MKNMGRVSSFMIMFITVALVCVSYRPAFSGVSDEEKAMETLSDQVLKKVDALKNKKIGVFDFTTLNGTEVPAGKRLSNKFMEYLIKDGKLIIVERTELDKLLKAQAIEQTGAVDIESAQQSGKVFAVDVIINGTISQVDKQMEIAIKAVDLKTGQILILSSVNMPSIQDYNYTENPGLVRLNKQAPEKLQAINKTYFFLKNMRTNRPLIFLLTVMNDDDWKEVARNKKALNKKLRERRNQLEQNRPEIIQTIKKLQAGLGLIREYEPNRYDEVMSWKKGIIEHPQGRR